MATSIAAHEVTRPPAIHRYTLASVLLLRAADHSVFAGWLITRQPGWLEIFRAGSVYAIVDGVLGILVAVLIVALARSPSGRWLVLIPVRQWSCLPSRHPPCYE